MGAHSHFLFTNKYSYNFSCDRNSYFAQCHFRTNFKVLIGVILGFVLLFVSKNCLERYLGLNLQNIDVPPYLSIRIVYMTF